MDNDAGGATRVKRALGIPALLAAAYHAFGYILLTLRTAEDRAGAQLPAFVMSAIAAADGRDVTGRAFSLPVSSPDEIATASEPEVIAGELAALGFLLARRRAAGGSTAGRPAFARQIHELLAAPA